MDTIRIVLVLVYQDSDDPLYGKFQMIGTVRRNQKGHLISHLHLASLWSMYGQPTIWGLCVIDNTLLYCHYQVSAACSTRLFLFLGFILLYSQYFSTLLLLNYLGWRLHSNCKMFIFAWNHERLVLYLQFFKYPTFKTLNTLSKQLF